jgi:predicted lipoprotein with Yx(FWY)xxD motif
MRASEEREGIKYLADGRGFTLYTHQGDVAGTETAPPRPECAGACEESFRPFNVRSLRPVTELEPGLFSVFVEPSSGRQQVSFRGLPLYLSKDDSTSGDMNGLTREGFSLALP